MGDDKEWEELDPTKFFFWGGGIDAYTVAGHVPDICNVCLRPNEFTDIFTAASDATFCAVTLDT